MNSNFRKKFRNRIVFLVFSFLLVMTGISQTVSDGSEDFALNLGLTIFFFITTIYLVWKVYTMYQQQKSYKAYIEYILPRKKVSLRELSNY